MIEVTSPVALLDFLKLEISDLHEDRMLFHFFSISFALRFIADDALSCEDIFSHASCFIFDVRLGPSFFLKTSFFPFTNVANSNTHLVSNLAYASLLQSQSPPLLLSFARESINIHGFPLPSLLLRTCIKYRKIS